MTLENLVKVRKLVPQPASREEIGKLLTAAQRNIQDAHVSDVSATTRFDAAYKAIMQCALASIRASGYRPSTSEPGHHITVIQSLPTTIGMSNERMIVLDAMRKKRNLNDYNGDGVSEEETEACVRAAEALLKDVQVWLKSEHPEFI
ncbi:MAG: DNA-binding protein [Marinobacter sp.]|uniref:DNA-binding protein n=1 Tax=Marinobacter sp. TaxID=50741 RepID=UPI00396E345A